MACRKCRTILETELSKRLNMCFYCRNRLRLRINRNQIWNEEHDNIKNDKRINEFERDYTLKDHLIKRKNWVEDGIRI